GRGGDSWHFMAEIERPRGGSSFRLGDKELAVHIERTRRPPAGGKLSAIPADCARHLGVRRTGLPITNDPVRTLVSPADGGTLDFQQYLGARRCEPVVKSLACAGAADAQLVPDLRETLADPSLQAIDICPSNPWLSIAPILEIPAWREALRETTVPVIAV